MKQIRLILGLLLLAALVISACSAPAAEAPAEEAIPGDSMTDEAAESGEPVAGGTLRRTSPGDGYADPVARSHVDP